MKKHRRLETIDPGLAGCKHLGSEVAKLAFENYPDRLAPAAYVDHLKAETIRLLREVLVPHMGPSEFDALTRRSRPEDLWGLPAIAAALSVSDDTVRRWAGNPELEIPVRRCGGRWFARRSELIAWREGR